GEERKAQARLRLEAQAMARLSHPNVVAVHDVSAVDAGIFIAMEFIEGRTLKSWLRASRRPWEEIVRAFADAGRGLAAAHRAGLVHRDFKPTNVLVRTDGRVAVTDFGLARLEAAAAPAMLGGDPATMHVTRTHGVAGTPAYMAPEVLAGKKADARADL